MAYALVTGGSSGIGRKYAEVLARDYHYDLLIVSIQQQELAERDRRALRSKGSDALSEFSGS